MWINPFFAVESEREVEDFVASHSLATVFEPGPLRAAHVPVLLHRGPRGGWVLTGHVAKADPIGATLAEGDGGEVLVVFHGPRAYVSPAWYGETGLPTYNFSVVHMTGRLLSRSDPAWVREHLLRLIAESDSWELDDAATARMERLLPAVVGFEIEVSEVQAKRKLSQNRSAEDRARVAASLRGSASGEDRDVAAQMEA